MRRAICTAALALLGFAGSALADEMMVRWNAVVGVPIHEEDSTNLIVGNISPTTGSIYVDSGKITLNLKTGGVAIDIRGVSWAYQGMSAGAGALGSRLGGTGFKRRAVFVCSAQAFSGDLAFTEVLYLNDKTGSISYRGTVDLPDSCRQYPGQIAFLFGGASDTGLKNYFAYGASAQLLGPDSE